MLVTFRCKRAPSITMFGEHATTLLKLMGQSGLVPGAIAAEDVPGAVQRLKTALAAGHGAEKAPEPSHGERAEEQAGVSLGTRALPLVDLLERAAAAKCEVTWD